MAPRFLSQGTGTLRRVQWTSDQELVLAHRGGWLGVIGGPGTGKTAVLVERWRRVAAEGVAPRVLVLTRSRDAADRFRRAALGDRWWASEQLPFTTPFGAAFDLVRRHLGDRRLLTRAEQWTLVRRILVADGPRAWPSCPDLAGRAAFVDEVAAAVLALEESGAGSDAVAAVASACGEGDRWADLIAFRHRYRQATEAAEALDGAQVIRRALDILADDEVAAEEAARWDEIVVDDAEELTAVMGCLVEALAGGQLGGGRLVAAGDVDGLRSAGLESAGLASMDGGSASAGMAPQAGGWAAGSWPGGGQAGGSSPWFGSRPWAAAVALAVPQRPVVSPTLVRGGHPSTEPDAIAAVLLDAHDAGVPWREMAVLMRRMSPRTRGIGRALARHGIPTRLTPGAAAGEPVVQALIDFFAWAAGDESALGRLLVSPVVDIGPADLRRLHREAGAADGKLPDHPGVARLVALRDRLRPPARDRRSGRAGVPGLDRPARGPGGGP